MVSSSGPAGIPDWDRSESRWVAVAAVHSLEAEAALPIFRSWLADEDPGVAAAGMLGLSWLTGAPIRMALARVAPAVMVILSLKAVW